jgi:hypothetical protein
MRDLTWVGLAIATQSAAAVWERRRTNVRKFAHQKPSVFCPYMSLHTLSDTLFFFDLHFDH